jgi:predicted  nucleic acid-binding Zn-ribbon protein
MTVRSEEAKAELKEAEQKLADAKAELADAKAELADAKTELKGAETQQGQVEQKLMQTKQADPFNTAEIQRLEEKWQTLNGDVAVLRRAFYSKSASVESKEAVVRRLESQLPVIVGPALASSGGETKMHRRQIAQRHQHCILMTCLSVSVCFSVLAAPTKKRRSEGIGITQPRAFAR